MVGSGSEIGIPTLQTSELDLSFFIREDEKQEKAAKKKAKQDAAQARREEEERERREAAERAEKERAEQERVDRARQEAEKREREAQKKLVKAERKRLRTLAKVNETYVYAYLTLDTVVRISVRDISAHTVYDYLSHLESWI